MAVSGTKAAVFRTIAQSRRSCPRFQTDRLIPSEILRDVLQSALRSPSSFNLQPTQIILVQDDEIKDRLSKEVMLGIGNQYRTKDCSALAVFLSDLEASKRIERIHRLEKEAPPGTRHPTYLAMMPLYASFPLGEGHAATFLKQVTTDLVSDGLGRPMPVIEPAQAWAYKNTALVAQSYVLAASSHDLATCIMEGFDGRRCREVLRIPDRYDIPMVVATGYDFEDDDGQSSREERLTPRLNIEEVVFADSFGVLMTDTGDEQTDGLERTA